MNIFFLDDDPHKAAQMQHDKHVVKMILETAQLLSTAWHELSPDNLPCLIYKRTHANHPCAVWCRTSLKNYYWLVSHGFALCEEYTHRYGKIHKTESVIFELADAPSRIKNFSPQITNPVQCMPDEYKQKDPVAAYRAYYNACKVAGAKWTNREIPEWVDLERVNINV